MRVQLSTTAVALLGITAALPVKDSLQSQNGLQTSSDEVETTGNQMSNDLYSKTGGYTGDNENRVTDLQDQTDILSEEEPTDEPKESKKSKNPLSLKKEADPKVKSLSEKVASQVDPEFFAKLRKNSRRQKKLNRLVEGLPDGFKKVVEKGEEPRLPQRQYARTRAREVLGDKTWNEYRKAVEKVVKKQGGKRDLVDKVLSDRLAEFVRDPSLLTGSGATDDENFGNDEATLRDDGLTSKNQVTSDGLQQDRALESQQLEDEPLSSSSNYEDPEELSTQNRMQDTALIDEPLYKNQEVQQTGDEFPSRLQNSRYLTEEGGFQSGPKQVSSSPQQETLTGSEQAVY